MRKIYRIQLSTEERAELEVLTRRKFVDGHKVCKARALLLCDESRDGPGMSDAAVIEATGMKAATLGRLRERCCEVGPLQALERAGRVEVTGMFANMTPLCDADQLAETLQPIRRLREEFGVYLVRSGRLCVAGLNTGNVERTAVAMAAVLGD